jgi:hypothetical protein
MSRRIRRLTARRAQRRTAAPARLLLGALGTAGAIVLGVVVGGGTFAAWAVSAQAAPSVTLQAGSAALTATPLQLSATGLYPGRTVYAPTTVRNTGTTALALAIDPVTGPTPPTAFTAALTVTAGIAASAADCTAGRTPAAVTTALGATAASDVNITLAPGASALLCIGIGLRTDAALSAAGAASTSVTVTVSGTQVAS